MEPLRNAPFWWMPQREAEAAEGHKKGYTDASRMGYYNTPFWGMRRRQKLDENPYCEHCEKDMIYINAKIVDHVVPVPKNTSFKTFVQLSSIDKLQSLCEKCHRSKTAYNRHGKQITANKERKESMQKFDE